MVTSHDVAKLAGVTQPTVSRALRGAPNVSARTREKVQAAAKALGYVPNPTGRALSTGRTNRIGLLVTDVTNQFYPHIIGPIHAQLLQRGLELVLLTDQGSADEIADRALGYQLSGAILATTTKSSRLPDLLRSRSIPFVYFNRTVPTFPADAVSTDPTPGLQSAIHRLHELGHRRFAAIHGPENATTGAFRADVIRRVVRDLGLALPPEQEHSGPFENETGARGVAKLMAPEERPTAILCGNDVIALGALNALRERNIAVPGDVAVTGFDDLPVASWPIVSLSTVHFDLESMARRAAELLIRRLEEPSSPIIHDEFPTTFVERATTGTAPA